MRESQAGPSRGGYGCLQGSKVVGSVMGNNSYVGDGCSIEDSLVLGNDYYTNDKTRAQSRDKGESALGIGAYQPSLWSSFLRCKASRCQLPSGPACEGAWGRFS